MGEPPAAGGRFRWVPGIFMRSADICQCGMIDAMRRGVDAGRGLIQNPTDSTGARRASLVAEWNHVSYLSKAVVIPSWAASVSAVQRFGLYIVLAKDENDALETVEESFRGGGASSMTAEAVLHQLSLQDTNCSRVF